jgi:hypothetical protein
MEDTTNLVLEHLRAIRSDIARLANRIETMAVELTAIRQHLGGVVTIQDHDQEISPRSSLGSTELSRDWN